MTAEDRDILISRVVDGTAREHDWSALEAMSATDAGVWRDIAVAQRQHARLVEEVGRAIEAADRVELEVEEPPIVIGRISSGRGSLARWGGWAAAAAVGLAWVSSVRGPIVDGDTNQSSLGSTMLPISADTVKQKFSNDDLLQMYVDKGRDTGQVVGVVPQYQVIEAVPAQGGRGQIEVYFARVIVERTLVNDWSQFSATESGELAPSSIKFKIEGTHTPH